MYGTEEVRKKVEFIVNKSSPASRYEMLAEECIELAHAALKYARILREEQPIAGALDISKVQDNIVEEYADVVLTADASFKGVTNDVINLKIADIYDEKLLRWYKRVKEKTGKGIEEENESRNEEN